MSEIPHKRCNAIHAPDWMVIDAVRYAMGRRSYQVGVTCGWVRAMWNKLNDHTRTIIKQDVEDEFGCAERTGNYSHLGHDCDIAEWKSVRELWEVKP